MGNRAVCGKETGSGAYPLRVLSVRTLHIRDLDRERRVQALGEFSDHEVCADCARGRLDADGSFLASARPKLLRFGAVLLAGVLIIALSSAFPDGSRVFLMLGLAAVFCGAAGMGSAWKQGKERSARLAGMSREEALREAAWAAFLDSAPRKNGDEDLSYIPVNEETLRRKNGDLMILYDLLPEIAVEAHRRIHEPPEGPG